MSSQEKGFEPRVETPSTSKTFPSLLAGIGASGAVLAAAATGFVFLVGAVSFDVWPQASPALDGTTGELSVPAELQVGGGAGGDAGGGAAATAPGLTASAPAIPVGGAVAINTPNAPAPKLGNAGLDAGAPSPGPAPDDGAGGSPGGGSPGGGNGGSGVADDDDELLPPIDVSRPLPPYGDEPEGDESEARPVHPRGGRHRAPAPSTSSSRSDQTDGHRGWSGGDGDSGDDHDRGSQHGDRGNGSGRGGD